MYKLGSKLKISTAECCCDVFGLVGINTRTTEWDDGSEQLSQGMCEWPSTPLWPSPLLALWNVGCMVGMHHLSEDRAGTRCWRWVSINYHRALMGSQVCSHSATSTEVELALNPSAVWMDQPASWKNKASLWCFIDFCSIFISTVLENYVCIRKATQSRVQLKMR